MRTSLATALLLGATAACQTAPAPARHPDPDSAFAGVQARGSSERGMGVDQSASTHLFDALPDGGRILFRMNDSDPAGEARIRAHLREIAAAFGRGDFRTPAFVHAMQVPGTDVMAARHQEIAYAVRDVPGGAELRMTTRDPAALRAIHAFMAFQRSDHRAGGHAH